MTITSFRFGVDLAIQTLFPTGRDSKQDRPRSKATGQRKGASAIEAGLLISKAGQPGVC